MYGTSPLSGTVLAYFLLISILHPNSVLLTENSSGSSYCEWHAKDEPHGVDDMLHLRTEFSRVIQ